MSTVKTTLPGSTLRELGEKNTWPTPPTAPGCSAIATVLHHLDDAGHGEAGIDAHVHRRRAGMRFLAGERELQPPQALPVGDDADLLVLGLEDRALLDMILEIGVHLARADRLVADPADALQLVAEGLALGVLAAIGIVERVDAGEDAGGQHGGRKARAFLVGPVDDDDRAPAS